MFGGFLSNLGSKIGSIGGGATGGTHVLTGGVSKTDGFKLPTTTGGGTIKGGIDLSALTSLLGQSGLGSSLGGQQQQTQQAQQGNTYNQMIPSPMLQQQMLPMIQNTFVPQTQMQNFQPYSLLNRNLG